MKSIGIGIFFLCAVLTSCAQDRADLVINPRNLAYEELNPRVELARLHGHYANSTDALDLNSDSTYMWMNAGRVERGTWELLDANVFLIAENRKTKVKILEVKREYLLVVVVDPKYDDPDEWDYSKVLRKKPR
jgi:hypothetical protein